MKKVLFNKNKIGQLDKLVIMYKQTSDEDEKNNIMNHIRTHLQSIVNVYLTEVILDTDLDMEILSYFKNEQTIFAGEYIPWAIDKWNPLRPVCLTFECWYMGLISKKVTESLYKLNFIFDEDEAEAWSNL